MQQYSGVAGVVVAALLPACCLLWQLADCPMLVLPYFFSD